MKTKLSKKAKIFLSVASAIITNTAITTLLTSCSLSNKINDIGGFDKEYGINNKTYARMEEDFKELYKSQLDQKKESAEINDDTYDLNLYTFQNNLNSLHTSLYSGENKTLSYTIKTNVLRDYARDNYGIRLSRQSSVSLAEVIGDIRSSIINSVSLWCKEYGKTDISEYQKKAETQFDILYDEAVKAYVDDVASIVQYIQSGMSVCFEGICEELDCLATQQQLKKFTEKYSISVKENVADDYCWDKLFSKYGDGNKEISAEDFNNIFEISYEDLEPQKVYSSYVFTSKKTVKFSNEMITGYILKPILVKMNGDPYTNTYSVDVDYTLVNSNYKDNTDVAKFTAHSSTLKNQSLYEDENATIFDLNASDEAREYTNYILPITKEYEEEQINTTYFNNEDFKFSWSTSEEYGYDDFWTEANENGEYKGKLDPSSLATSGMMINGVLVSDILSQAGKISLSGGSVSLSGKPNTEGEDAKQWKLIVDGNEIKNEDISWKLIPATNTELPNSIHINDGTVSWTNQIETGIYEFYILVNYKEIKIQSAQVALNISSSKQSENVENFNHNIKNMLYDEDTIDQKLIDFVNNINFSLEYTENDYDTEREDHKKGEIEINNFIIGYKNSKNTFKASNSINEAISNAINNDSGIISRYSENLYLKTSLNFDAAAGVRLVINTVLFDEVDSTSEHVNNMYAAGYIIFSTCIVLELIFSIYIFKRIGAPELKIIFLISVLLLALIPIGYFISLLTEVNEYINNVLKWCKLSSQNDRGRTRFEDKLNDDQKYFSSNTSKSEYDKLSPKEVRALTYFYSNFCIRPTDYKSDDERFANTPYKMYDEYIEFNDKLENDTKYLYNVLISGLVLVAMTVVISITFFCYLMKNSKKEIRRIISERPQEQNNSINGNQSDISNNAIKIDEEINWAAIPNEWNDTLKKNGVTCGIKKAIETKEVIAFRPGVDVYNEVGGDSATYDNLSKCPYINKFYLTNNFKYIGACSYRFWFIDLRKPIDRVIPIKMSA